jgi:eukaryotic-like serine/threonine-protein kinase
MVTRTDQEASDKLIGQRVGDSYTIVRFLGSGGMGAVYVAESAAFGGKPVAVKILTTTNSEAIARFRREAYAAGKISDQFSTVGLIDTGVLRTGEHYISLEYCDGGSLQAVLEMPRRTPGLSFDDILAYSTPVCSALAKAHKEGVVHRDIKPANILFVRDGKVLRAKLADFGIAKLREEAGMLVTAPTAIFGTPGYMSPEQCQHTADVDSRSDIYSIGCVLYEMVTGRLPYLGSGSVQMRQAASNALIVPPSMLRRDTPKVLDDTIMKCLAFRREDRFATAVEVVRNLAASVENGEAKMAFFAPHLVEEVALAPTANTVSASGGPALTKYAQAAHSAIRRTRRRALSMFVAGLLVGSIVAVGATMTLMSPVDASAPETNSSTIAVEDHAKPAPPELKPPTQPELKPPTQPELKPPAQPELKPPTQPELKPPTQPELKQPTQPELKPPTQPELKPPTQPELKPPTQPELKPPTQPELKQPTQPELKQPTQPELKPSTQPEPAPKPPSQAEPKPKQAQTRLPRSTEASQAAPTVHASPPRAPNDASNAEVWLSVRVKGFAEVSIDDDLPGTSPRRKRVRPGVHHVVITGFTDGSDQQQRKEFDVTVPAGKEETVIYKSW